MKRSRKFLIMDVAKAFKCKNSEFHLVFVFNSVGLSQNVLNEAGGAEKKHMQKSPLILTNHPYRKILNQT